MRPTIPPLQRPGLADLDSDEVAYAPLADHCLAPFKWLTEAALKIHEKACSVRRGRLEHPVRGPHRNGEGLFDPENLCTGFESTRNHCLAVRRKRANAHEFRTLFGQHLAVILVAAEAGEFGEKVRCVFFTAARCGDQTDSCRPHRPGMGVGNGMGSAPAWSCGAAANDGGAHVTSRLSSRSPRKISVARAARRKLRVRPSTGKSGPRNPGLSSVRRGCAPRRAGVPPHRDPAG